MQRESAEAREGPAGYVWTSLFIVEMETMVKDMVISSWVC